MFKYTIKFKDGGEIHGGQALIDHYMRYQDIIEKIVTNY